MDTNENICEGGCAKIFMGWIGRATGREAKKGLLQN